MEGDSGAGNVLMSLWCFAVGKKGDARGIKLCKSFFIALKLMLRASPHTCMAAKLFIPLIAGISPRRLLERLLLSKNYSDSPTSEFQRSTRGMINSD